MVQRPNRRPGDATEACDTPDVRPSEDRSPGGSTHRCFITGGPSAKNATEPTFGSPLTGGCLGVPPSRRHASRLPDTVAAKPKVSTSRHLCGERSIGAGNISLRAPSRYGRGHALWQGRGPAGRLVSCVAISARPRLPPDPTDDPDSCVRHRSIIERQPVSRG